MGRSRPQIEVKGLRDLRRDMRGMTEALDDLKRLNAAAAKDVEGAARPLVPRRTGQLASTLRSSGQRAGGVVRAGRHAVPYAGPIHFGWPARGIRPQPFIYEAADRRRMSVLALYEKGIEDMIGRHDLG